jgi:hypothetical protein
LSDLSSQAKAWLTILNLIENAAALPDRLSEVLTASFDRAHAIKKEKFLALFEESTKSAIDAHGLLVAQESAIVYPGLVGSWAIIEAAFDDLMIAIIVNDPSALKRIFDAGIKASSNNPLGSAEWAKDIYKRIEGKMKSASKGCVVETHRRCFGIFGIELIYPSDRSCTIEALNQVRNCILHNQGKIDKKAVSISPQLSQYLNEKIPFTDPLFAMSMKTLVDYITAWIAALIHSHYLSAALKKDAANPFLQ